MSQSRPIISDEIVKRIATRTGADSRTVVRRLAGLPVKGAAGKAIERELVKCGLVDRMLTVALENGDGEIELSARSRCTPRVEADASDVLVLISTLDAPLNREFKSLGDCNDGDIIYVAYESSPDDETFWHRGRVLSTK